MSLLVKRIKLSLSIKQLIKYIILLVFMLYYIFYCGKDTNVAMAPPNLLIMRYVEYSLEEALKEDKGSGCDVPKLDPFSPEIMQFNQRITPIECISEDWVTCYLSKCRPKPETMETVIDLQCTYNDIIHVNDHKRYYGPDRVVSGNEAYKLVKSDHVKIHCSGLTTGVTSKAPNNTTSLLLFGKSSWTGLGTGFRTKVESVSPSPVHAPTPRTEDNYDILIFGFDSTSKNAFVRNMPDSYRLLTKELGATVLNRYNILGDATPAALFPILSGRSELELPEARKSVSGSGYLDEKEFIFHKMKKIGYRTAYYEEMPWVGTFQYRFHGFRKQPADHYSRDLFVEEYPNKDGSWMAGHGRFCFGGTPRFELVMNLTEQFFLLKGKHFIFSFVADIVHGDSSYMYNADVPLTDFLRRMDKNGIFKNTLLIVMADHGSRHGDIRQTYQGKLEERLPFMAIRLPDNFRKRRPEAQAALESNVEALTTPHDIHNTLLDLVNLSQFWNPYKVNGADLPRAMTLLQPVPRSRSCSEAGIAPHWCTCLRWEEVTASDPMYTRAAHALVNYINNLTITHRRFCVVRTLVSVQSVLRRQVNVKLLKFETANDVDTYVGKFGKNTLVPRELYQVKITVGPKNGIYEAAVTYLKQDDAFQVSSSDISRINAYNNEPKCISDTHPHLNMYCYCGDTYPAT